MRRRMAPAACANGSPATACGIEFSARAMPNPPLPGKYRAPRPRRDVVPRAALLASTRARAAAARLVLVQAPAGYGKTTLLAQLAGALATEAKTAVAWVSLDPEDNDCNRLFAAVFAALGPLDLPWPLPPAALLAQLKDASPAARTALGVLTAALGTRAEAPVALVLDDLHHIDEPHALQLLDALIARAPPELMVLIGSRVVPPLSLARWRAGGELVELGVEDLRFDADAAQALCGLRGLNQPSGEALQQALAEGSEFRESLRRLDPDRTTVTVWVYPDSFDEFRAVKMRVDPDNLLSSSLTRRLGIMESRKRRTE